MVRSLTRDGTRRFYDRLGAGQDRQAFYEDAATRRLVELAHFDRAEAVLELGCGTGRFAGSLFEQYLSRDCRYVGVDLSPHMVELATDQLALWQERARVRVGAVDDPLPDDDGAFDRVVANYVFDLLLPDDTAAALAEAARVLRPGGVLCTTSLTHGVTSASRALMRAWTAAWRRRPMAVGGCRPIALADALEPAGWHILRREVVVAWAVPSEVVVATPPAATG